jgi:hypothetical protein
MPGGLEHFPRWLLVNIENVLERNHLKEAPEQFSKSIYHFYFITKVLESSQKHAKNTTFFSRIHMCLKT